MSGELDVRTAAMAYVADHCTRGGGVVTRGQLESFRYDGEQLKLVDQNRGIRNPRQLEATLTIMSQPKGPYDDVETADGLLRYAYRAGDPATGDNRKLRRAAELELPLILLQGIAPGVFVPVFPVYIVRDVPEERYVEVALDESLRFLPRRPDVDERAYAERLTRLRLHQPVFRARVIRAYETQCAMCRLKHAGLLDAAHILPDDHPQGQPVIPNGLSLCKIHHVAYDLNIVGVRPDHVIEVQQEVLREVDGPMLRHGLQAMEGVSLAVPHARDARPDPVRLEERYTIPGSRVTNYRRTGYQADAARSVDRQCRDRLALSRRCEVRTVCRSALR